MPDPKPRRKHTKKGAMTQTALKEVRHMQAAIPSTLQHMASRSFHGYGGPRVGGVKAPGSKLVGANKSHIKAAKKMTGKYKPTASKQALRSYKRLK